MQGDTSDAPNDFLLFNCSDADHPVLVLTGRSECPLQELDGVIKPEHVVIIFDVVFREMFIQFFCLFVISHVDVEPFKSSGEFVGFFSYVVACFDF